MFTPKLFSLFAAAFLTCAYTVPASANDSMATPAAQSSAMTGGSAPMKAAAMPDKKKTATPMAKAGAKSTSAGMSTGAMGSMSSDHMAAKPTDAAMKDNMSSH
jgi:hypothetical protein